MPTSPQRRGVSARSRLRRRASGAITMSFALLPLLAGCVTCERPTLEPVPQTDDPAAATVIQRLDRADRITFTATYEITPIGAAEPTVATVRQSGDRRRVTIGSVDFVTDGVDSTTCLLDTGECFGFLDDARVSDLGITNRFWSEGFARRLTVDAARRVGFSTGTVDTIADRPAVCAEVPVLGGDKLYCALDEGVLARYFGADVQIELTEYSNEVDETQLTDTPDFDD